MKTERKPFKAVYDEELIPFLKKLHLYSRIMEKKIKCHFCKDVITLDNFGGVFRKNDEIKVFCNKPECYYQALKKNSIH